MGSSLLIDGSRQKITFSAFFSLRCQSPAFCGHNNKVYIILVGGGRGMCVFAGAVARGSKQIKLSKTGIHIHTLSRNMDFWEIINTVIDKNKNKAYNSNLILGKMSLIKLDLMRVRLGDELRHIG